MNALELTRDNIKSFGYIVGESVRGKGTELLEQSRYITCVSKFVKDNPKQLALSLARLDREDLFVTNIFLENGKNFRYTDDMVEYSLERFNVKEIIAKDFRGIKEVEFSTLPRLVTNRFKLSGYKSDRDSQFDLMCDLARLTSNVHEDEFYDSSYDEPNDILDHSAYSDYEIATGTGYCADHETAEHIDCRLGEYNESAVSSFYDFEYDYMVDYMKELDPDEKYTVYHRKGKDFYITPSLLQVDNEFSFVDEEGDLDSEGFYYFEYSEDKKLEEKLIGVIVSYRDNLNLEGGILNGLHTGNSFSDYSYAPEYPLVVLNREFDDMWDLKNDLLEFAEAGSTPDTVMESFLWTNLVNEKLFGVYSHIGKLRKLAEADGRELVYTAVGEFTDKKQYAIKYHNEEYHFNLAWLFSSTPKKTYDKIVKGLNARLHENISQSTLYEKAKNVFVGVEDSFDSGNCSTGTYQFCAKHNIDINKVGGIRGDVLLQMDYSAFTRRAVIAAVGNHHKVGANERVQ